MSTDFGIDQLVEMALVASPNSNGAATPTVDTMSCPPLPGSAQVDGTLGASASPWLDNYIRFSRIWSPRSYDGFHEAVALWVLSTVAAGRIRVHLGRQRFPALYIALCSRTSLHAKSSATEIGRDLLIDAGLDWLLLPDSVTPQRFIQEMAGLLPREFSDLTPSQQDRIKMRLALSGKRGWYYEEFGEKLAAMMRQNGTMADFRGHLRRLDDGLPSYEYGTIMRGTERIEGPYLALLANLTPADLRPYAQPNGPLWHDGFFARFAFIAPPNTAERSRGTFPKGQRLFPEELMQPLRAWHQRLGMPDVNVESSPGDASLHWKLAGDYHPTTCILGEGVFDAFYRYHDALLDIAQESRRTDLDGNYARFAEKALRVSMLLASLGNNDVIELCHWARAQTVTERWRCDLHNLVAGLSEQGPSEGQLDEEKVLHQLRRLCAKQVQCTAREIGQRIDGMDTATAERHLASLVRNGLATKETGNRTTFYRTADVEP